MAVTYNLGFDPFWAIFDLLGRPAGGAQMFTSHALNPTIPFPVYKDSGGAEAWPNPILFDENGQQGPFYFLFDSNNPSDTYFIQVFDSTGSQLIWQIDNYSPITGSGGGSVVTNNLSLTNLLGNSVFWRNNGTFTNPTNNTILCPGNHAAMNPSDIRYVRTGGGPADTITFTKFSPAGFTPLTGDVTPEYYLNYQSTGVPGETLKGISYPIVSHLKTLEKQVVSYQFWAKGNSGVQQLTLYIYQYTGSGGAPTVTSPQVVGGVFNLTPNWARYSGTFTIPTSAGLTLGTNGNDALYLIMGFPLSAATNVDYTKLSLYIGNVATTNVITDFETYDLIDSVINTPRTGDVRVSMNSFAPFGWVAMNDGTIGKTGSAATNRANDDTFFLYKLIYEATAANQTFAPVSGGRTGNADNDFASGKTLQLLYSLGAVLGNVGTTNSGSGFYTNLATPVGGWKLGQPLGGESVLLHHVHLPLSPSTSFIGAQAATSASINAVPPGTGNVANLGSTGDTGNVTAGQPTIQPTLRMNFFMKL